MGFFRSTLPKYYHNHVSKNHPFMTCIVRVNTESQWQRTVSKVLDKCYGVTSFRMDNNGVVEISGCVDPSLLLKMLRRAGRSAELCWFQFGECSSNLFVQPDHGGSRDGRFLHPTSTSRPRPPSQQALTNQNYGYYDHDNQYYSYGHDHDYHRGHYDHDNQYYYSYGHDNRGYGYGYGYYDHDNQYGNRLGHQQQRSYDQSGYDSHARNQIHTRSALPSHDGEDIGCCRVM